MEGHMQATLEASNPSLEGNLEVNMTLINGEDLEAGCTRRPKMVQMTMLTFVSTLARDFDSDFDTIQDEFTRMVQDAFSVENVAKAFQTQELEEKYGQFTVVGTQTEGVVQTLVSIARDCELARLIFATYLITCNLAHHRDRPLVRVERVSQKN